MADKEQVIQAYEAVWELMHQFGKGPLHVAPAHLEAIGYEMTTFRKIEPVIDADTPRVQSVLEPTILAAYHDRKKTWDPLSTQYAERAEKEMDDFDRMYNTGLAKAVPQPKDYRKQRKAQGDTRLTPERFRRVVESQQEVPDSLYENLVAMQLVGEALIRTRVYEDKVTQEVEQFKSQHPIYQHIKRIEDAQAHNTQEKKKVEASKSRYTGMPTYTAQLVPVEDMPSDRKVQQLERAIERFESNFRRKNKSPGLTFSTISGQGKKINGVYHVALTDNVGGASIKVLPSLEALTHNAGLGNNAATQRASDETHKIRTTSYKKIIQQIVDDFKAHDATYQQFLQAKETDDPKRPISAPYTPYPSQDEMDALQKRIEDKITLITKTLPEPQKKEAKKRAYWHDMGNITPIDAFTNDLIRSCDDVRTFNALMYSRGSLEELADERYGVVASIEVDSLVDTLSDIWKPRTLMEKNDEGKYVPQVVDLEHVRPYVDLSNGRRIQFTQLEQGESVSAFEVGTELESNNYLLQSVKSGGFHIIDNESPMDQFIREDTPDKDIAHVSYFHAVDNPSKKFKPSIFVRPEGYVQAEAQGPHATGQLKEKLPELVEKTYLTRMDPVRNEVESMVRNMVANHVRPFHQTNRNLQKYNSSLQNLNLAAEVADWIIQGMPQEATITPEPQASQTMEIKIADLMDLTPEQFATIDALID